MMDRGKEYFYMMYVILCMNGGGCMRKKRGKFNETDDK